jgi:hypothetical protein
MIQAVFVFAVLALLIAAYKIGEREGKRREADRLADDLRSRVHTSIIDPWLESFKRSFYVGGTSYTLDEHTLGDCAKAAQKLFAFRSLLPDSPEFAVHRVWTLASYATTSQSLSVPGTGIDPHFGQPTGYVDAFVEILVKNKGRLPKQVWLNEDTGELADHFEDDEGPGESYARITITS